MQYVYLPQVQVKLRELRRDWGETHTQRERERVTKEPTNKVPKDRRQTIRLVKDNEN